jgi:hypothetical protein
MTRDANFPESILVPRKGTSMSIGDISLKRIIFSGSLRMMDGDD